MPNKRRAILQGHLDGGRPCGCAETCYVAFDAIKTEKRMKTATVFAAKDNFTLDDGEDCVV